MTPHDRFIDTTLHHPLDHQKYKDIAIPPKWQQYIQDNLKCGLKKVCTSQCVELMTADLPVKHWQDILPQTGVGKTLLSDRKLFATAGFKRVSCGSALMTRLNQYMNGVDSLGRRKISKL